MLSAPTPAAPRQPPVSSPCAFDTTGGTKIVGSSRQRRKNIIDVNADGVHQVIKRVDRDLTLVGDDFGPVNFAAPMIDPQRYRQPAIMAHGVKNSSRSGSGSWRFGSGFRFQSFGS